MAIYSESPQFGSSAPDFQLRGVDRRTYSLKDFAEARALVVVFMCNHCPYVVAVQKRINQLAQEFSPRGVQLVAINSNDSIQYPDDSFEKMQIRAEEQGFVFPYLWDETQEVAQKYGAVCTPEFYVYERSTGQWALRYRGRLDDSWKEETQVQQRDLALALECILKGQPVSPDQKPSMGCSIKWKC